MAAAPRVVLIALLAAAAASPAVAQNEATERFSKTSHLDGNGAFDLSNLTGNIVITAGAGRDVVIDAVKRVQRPNANGARALLQLIDIQVVEQPNRIEVRTVYPRPRNFPGAVDYTITVPNDARVTLRTTTGAIRATGVQVESVKVVSGDIEIVNAAADDFFTGSTVSGNITVRGLEGGTVQLATVTGNVTVDGLQAERLMVRAVSGTLEYAGEVARNGRYEFVSHSGDIRLALAGTTGFEVQANSFSGTVQSDFPIGRRGRGGEGAGRGRGAGRGLRGAFGDGSAMLVLRAFSGNISISRR